MKKDIIVFYEITWRDAETENGWENVENCKVPNKLTKSYGFFVKAEKNYFTIAADYDEETKHFNRFMHIPMEMIKRKRRIKL